MVKKKRGPLRSLHNTAENYHLENLFPSMSFRYYHAITRPDLYKKGMDDHNYLNSLKTEDEHIQLIFNRKNIRIMHPGYPNCNVADPNYFTVLQTLLCKFLIQKDAPSASLSEIVDYIERYWQYLRKNIAPPYNSSCKQAVLTCLRTSTFEEDKLFHGFQKEGQWRLFADGAARRPTYGRKEYGSGPWAGRKRGRGRSARKLDDSNDRDHEVVRRGPRKYKRGTRNGAHYDDSSSDSKPAVNIPNSPQYTLKEGSVIKNGELEYNFKLKNGDALSDIQSAIANIIQEGNGYASLEAISSKIQEYGVVPKKEINELVLTELTRGSVFRRYKDEWMNSRRVVMIDESSSEGDEEDDEGDEEGEEGEDESDKEGSEEKMEADEKEDEDDVDDESEGEGSHELVEGRATKLKSYTDTRKEKQKRILALPGEEIALMQFEAKSDIDDLVGAEVPINPDIIDLLEDNIIQENSERSFSELGAALTENWGDFKSQYVGINIGDVLRAHLKAAAERMYQIPGSDNYDAIKRYNIRTTKRRRILRSSEK